MNDTAVARSKIQTWIRRPRLTRKRRTALQASQHLHNHDPREARSRGDVARLIGGYLMAPPDRRRIHTAILRRSQRLRCSGRAGHDSHRGAGERSSVRSRCLARVQFENHSSVSSSTYRNPGKNRGKRQAPKTFSLVIQKSAAHEIPNPLESLRRRLP